MSRPCSGQCPLGTSFSRCRIGGVTVVVHHHRRRTEKRRRFRAREEVSAIERLTLGTVPVDDDVMRQRISVVKHDRERRTRRGGEAVLGAPHEASASMANAAVTLAMRSCRGRGANGTEA